jgi:hypothetical protein
LDSSSLLPHKKHNVFLSEIIFKLSLISALRPYKKFQKRSSICKVIAIQKKSLSLSPLPPLPPVALVLSSSLAQKLQEYWKVRFNSATQINRKNKVCFGKNDEVANAHPTTTNLDRSSLGVKQTASHMSPFS